MSTIISILLIASGLLVLLLILALIMKKEHYVRREINIKAPRQKVYDYLKLLKNQEEFNKHAKAGSERQKTFKGTDGTVGYIYAWSGDKNAGIGEKEIINLIDGQKIETEIRFTKPMKVKATVIMEIESLTDDETKVSWSNAGTLPYPFNVMIPLMEKSVAKDMDFSLNTLKNILERTSAEGKTEV